jgi:hypothetical protein
MPVYSAQSCYAPFTVLTALTALSYHPQHTDCDLRIVTHFSHLTYLNTSTSVEEHLLPYLANDSSVDKVPLYGPEFDQVLPHMTRLRELHIDHARLTSQQFSRVSLLLALHTLSYNFSDSVNVNDFSALEPCTGLTVRLM